MVKKVLIVDDSQEMLLSLKDGLEKYHDTFTVLLAKDAMSAKEKLKKNVVSLVVTDLKMPHVDGFSLLSYIMEHYPEIPVVIMTGYSTPEMEKHAREGGASGYIEKPFIIEDLARTILTSLRSESDGGTLHSVSSGIFLQLIEMEQKTCTIRLVDKASDRRGVLFFQDGMLLDARYDSLFGEDAAYEIFSWDEVNLTIQNGCAQKNSRIQKDLQSVMLEAMRRKDEKDTHPETLTIKEDGAEIKQPTEPESMQPETLILEEVNSVNQTLAPEDAASGIKHKIQTHMGERSGLKDVYTDSSWQDFLEATSGIGALFNFGKIKLSYIDKGAANDFILVPGEQSTVVAVSSKCPRDRIFQILAE